MIKIIYAIFVFKIQHLEMYLNKEFFLKSKRVIWFKLFPQKKKINKHFIILSYCLIMIINDNILIVIYYCKSIYLTQENLD